MKFCFNGELLESSEAAQISVLDESVQYGISVFETLRTYHSREIFCVEKHLERLFHSAEILKIAPFVTRTKIEKALERTVQANANPDFNLRLKILLAANFFWIRCEKLEEMPDAWYSKGVVVQSAVHERIFPEAKFSSPAYRFFQMQQTPGMWETIFFDRQGFLREGNISNVFAVFGKVVATPDERILRGVTREKVIALVGTCHGMSLQLREIHRDELAKADEIFLTNTTKEVVSVQKWETWKSQNFAIAKMLREKFQNQI